MSGADEPVEPGVSAQPGIDPVVVDRVIAMGGGLRYSGRARPRWHPNLLRSLTTHLCVEPTATVAVGPSSVGAAETKRVDQPPQRRHDPGWLGARYHRS